MIECKFNNCKNKVDQSGKGGHLRKLCPTHRDMLSLSKRSSPVNDMISNARKRAEVTIIHDDIYAVWPVDNKCPALKIDFIIGSGRNQEQRIYAPSIDRIDSKKGYHKGNIQIISLLANQIKTTANAEEVQLVATYMKENLE